MGDRTHFRQLKRREFIAVLGGGVGAWPLAARAQQAVPVIGHLHGTSPGPYAPVLPGFHQGLYRGQAHRGRISLGGRPLRSIAALAADLVDRHVTVIAAPATPAVLAAKAATTTIPIVFASGGDPVKLGFVASLNRPGGNVTGISFVSAALGEKSLGLLHELQPGAVRVGCSVVPER